MIKKNHLFLLSLLFVFFTDLGLFSSVFGLEGTAKEQELNVLLITIDTLRTDRVSCYSSQHIQTPNMDRLAKKGVVFTRAFSHNPTTLPSHTNMLLGLTPLYHGVRENTNFVARAELLTLAEYLKDIGYSTGAFIGGYPLHSRFGLAQGFDVYDEDYERMKFVKFSAGERKAGEVIDSALRWLEPQKSKWFCWVHCFDPHDPYEPPEPFSTQYEKSPYDGEVAYVDRELGRLLDHMEKKELFDNTLIIFTGDHGESLGQHGEMTHGYLANNTTIWVPLILSYPSSKPGRVDQNVSHIDIFPTVCDILRIKKPDALQGISLLPGMEGKKLPGRTIYFESLYPYYSRGWAPIKGFIQDGVKYIQSPIPELYDLKADFDESRNLAESQRLDIYRKRLNEIIEQYSHPANEKAQHRIDMKSLERLRSLGYISSPQVATKKSYGPTDDVKTLLPFHNKAVKAWELYQEGRIQEGFDLVKEVITERQDVDIAYSHLAKMYKEQEKLKEALGVLELALEHLPSNYGVLITYVSYLNLAGRNDDVIDIVEHLQLPQMENDPEIWNYLGLAYSNKGEFTKAIDALAFSLSVDDEFAYAYRSLGTVYLSRFLEARDKEDLMKSIRNFEKAINFEPDFAAAYNSLGVAYKENNQTDKAMSCWDKAYELRPDVGYPLLNLGLVYLERGDKVKAMDFFKTYKKSFYSSLSSSEKERLDALIRKCERKP
ncbi:MAG: sulfatase-like hydrolase/transferase [Candidatus Aminicenantaceae bacterium]|jgi:arylsulfatase A-like enzyme/Flp pilus assembly protein TadD